MKKYLLLASLLALPLASRGDGVQRLTRNETSLGSVNIDSGDVTLIYKWQ